MTFPFPISDLTAILPEILLTIIGICILLIDLFIPSDKKEFTAYLSLGGIIIVFISLFSNFRLKAIAFSGMFIHDPFAIFFKIIFLIVAALTILISINYLKIESAHKGEYYILILFATLGMMILASAGSLLTLYLGLETMAISVCVLVCFFRKDAVSNEAAIKYLLLSIFASAILLYGIALIYGLTGTDDIAGIGNELAKGNFVKNTGLLLAVIMLTVGFGFKIAMVPFHMWAPDVYEGAPTSVAAFMSVGPKAAGFAVLLRVFLVGISSLKPNWVMLFWFLSVASMTTGNIIAIAQSNIKRMLAYSSIAHVGYALIGLVVADQVGITAVLLYIFVYAFMNMGAFSTVILLCRKGMRGDKISDFTGLAQTNPLAAVIMLIFLLSLAGIPPTAGFIGKFYIFAAAIKANYIWLAVLGVLNTAVSVYYYFKILLVMYMRTPSEKVTLSLSPSLMTALAIMAVVTILIGIFPSPFLNLAKISIFGLL